jgi:hypothetical protein
LVPNRQSLRSLKDIFTGNCTNLTADAKRTTTTDHGTFVVCHCSQLFTYATNPMLMLEDHIHNNDKWAIHTLQYTENGQNIAQALILGTAVAVCDGSYKDQFGTAGFIIQCGDSNKSHITGAHVTPGCQEDINPYCSELGGILTIIVITEAITSFRDIHDGTIKIRCDCKSGIRAIFKHIYDTPKQSHHDLIHEI